MHAAVESARMQQLDAACVTPVNMPAVDIPEHSTIQPHPLYIATVDIPPNNWLNNATRRRGVLNQSCLLLQTLK